MNYPTGEVSPDQGFPIPCDVSNFQIRRKLAVCLEYMDEAIKTGNQIRESVRDLD